MFWREGNRILLDKGHPEVIKEHFAPKIIAAVGDANARLRDELGGSEALANFLDQAVSDADPVLLVVNDSHRATLTREALRALEDVSRRRVPQARFHLLIACGTHEFSESEQRAFERELLQEVNLSVQGVDWHCAKCPETLRRLGGFQFHSRLAQCRYVLPIGSVEPHYFAGVTGPHKTVTIGCMSYDDIRVNHQGALSVDSDILRLDGNPVYEGVRRALEALRFAGKEICCIGEVASGSSLVDVRVGDPLEVVHALLPAAMATFVHVIAERVDLLHLRVPMPLGRSLYQADKALKNNHRAVRDGGGIILEARCAEGVGASSFLTLLRRAPTLAEARGLISREGYALGDHKAIKLRELTDPAGRGVHVALVSDGINRDDAGAAGMALFQRVEDARVWINDQLDSSMGREALIDDAGFVTVAPKET